MTVSAALERGRGAFAARAWDVAHAEFSAADRESALGPADLEELATAAYLTGHDDDSDEYWTRAHRGWLAAGEPDRAARCAFWLSFVSLIRGQGSRSAGWLARAERLLEGRQDCVEQGYLTYLAGMPQFAAGSSDEAFASFSRAAEVAERFADPDLLAFARLSLGEVLVQMGRTSEGLRLLDELMVAVTTGDVSAIPAGIAYCAGILACQKILDLQRVSEWTTALGDWCARQQGLVPFEGQCLVHRSEILQLHGSWRDAAAEAQHACDAFSGPTTLGMAFYQCGELYRLQGEFEKAEESYRQAAVRGHDPQPGLSLLRLAQGQLDAALAAIRRVMAEGQDPDDIAGGPPRCRLLSAYVNIMLAKADVEAARTGADELDELAAVVDVPLLHGMAGHAAGAVLLAEDRADAALDRLRRACSVWQTLQAPYELARTRVLMGLACRRLGDHDTGQMHLEAARTVFRDLGARPDLAQLEKLALKTAPGAAGVLTPRELEVLRLVALGKSNRDVAAALFLSEKTVARHVSNILTKLGLASRSAATAYAYEHGLV